MHGTSQAGVPWTPSTEADRAAVLRQMRRLLDSHHFKNSKRYPALLEYIIRETLAGNSDSLKERVLGILVFHRPADYDTNADPVVRVTAGEIRKRIAQFYHEEGDTGELHIDLRPGSYVPEFHLAASRVADMPELLSPVPVDVSLQKSAELAEPHPHAIPKRHRLAWYFCAFGIIAIILSASVRHWRMPQDQRSQMWYPLFASPAPVLIVVGQPHLPQLEIPSVDNVFYYEHSAASQLELPDAIAMAHLCSMLDAHHRPYQISGVSSATLSDLRKGPVILVGAFNNPWTTRILQPLRFSLKSVSHGDSTTSPQILQIADRKNQRGSPWTVDFNQPVSAMTHDYAIIARFQSNMTDNVVLVAAGIGSGGTESASKFISSATYMTQLATHAPRNWRNMNMEAVLETEVIGGRAGHPHVVAAEFW